MDQRRLYRLLARSLRCDINQLMSLALDVQGTFMAMMELSENKSVDPMGGGDAETISETSDPTQTGLFEEEDLPWSDTPQGGDGLPAIRSEEVEGLLRSRAEIREDIANLNGESADA